MRFNGEHAEAPDDRGYIMRYDLDAEFMNAGFWPGDDNAANPVFYAYINPKPDDCELAPINAEGAAWIEQMGEWMLPYDAVLASERPSARAARVPRQRLRGRRIARRVGPRAPRLHPARADEAHLTFRPRRGETVPECQHLRTVPVPEPEARTVGCEECLAIGQSWVHLRKCLVCGHVGCCDQSVGKHATKHFHETGACSDAVFRAGRGMAILLHRRGDA